MRGDTISRRPEVRDLLEFTVYQQEMARLEKRLELLRQLPERPRRQFSSFRFPLRGQRRRQQQLAAGGGC